MPIENELDITKARGSMKEILECPEANRTIRGGKLKYTLFQPYILQNKLDYK